MAASTEPPILKLRRTRHDVGCRLSPDALELTTGGQVNVGSRWNGYVEFGI
jgi:hypothetical protein